MNHLINDRGQKITGRPERETSTAIIEKSQLYDT